MSEFAHEPMHTAALAAAVEQLTMTVERFEAVMVREERGARLPWRNSAVSNEPAVVRNSPVKLTWAHAMNEQGVADAYLQLYDEYQADAVIVGQTTPRLTLWLPAGAGLDDLLPAIEFDRGIVVAATNTRDGASAPDHPVLVDLATVPGTAGLV